jgi:hypothetical protein
MDLGRFLVEAVVLGGARPSELIRTGAARIVC